MRRLRATYTTSDGTIPDPLDSVWSDERYAYVYVKKGSTTFDAASIRAWAAEPLKGQLLCIVTENTEILESGWQEGAAKSAHSCMRGPVFKDVIPNAQTVTNWERVKANITSGPERYLDSNNKNSGNDICLCLRNEYTGRDLANITTCGTPKTYIYPTRSQLLDGTYAPDQALWSNLVTTAVYQDARPRILTRGRNHLLA
jgi:hypothetical protein